MCVVVVVGGHPYLKAKSESVDYLSIEIYSAEFFGNKGTFGRRTARNNGTANTINSVGYGASLYRGAAGGQNDLANHFVERMDFVIKKNDGEQ